MQCYYLRVIHFAKLFRMTDSPHFTEIPEVDIRACFTGLLAQNKHEDAWRVAAICKDVPNDDTFRIFAQTLLGDENTPVLVKAKVMSHMAELPDQQNNDMILNTTDTIEHLQSEARNIFLETGHAFGALDIDFRRACKALNAGSGSIEENWEVVLQYDKDMETLDNQSKILYFAGAVLDATDHILPFEFKVHLIRECEKRSRKIGARLFWILFHVQIVARWRTLSGHASKAIEGAKGLCDELESSDCNWLKGFAAQNLSQAYCSLGDHEHALQWATACYSDWESLSLADKAEARKQVLQAETTGRIVPAHVATQLLETNLPYVEEELHSGLALPAVEKIEMILSQIILRHRHLDSSPWMNLFEKGIEPLPKEVSSRKLASFYQIKGDLALSGSQVRTDFMKEDEAIELFEMSIQLYIQQKEMFSAANSRQKGALVHWGKHRKSHSVAELQKAVDHFEKAGDYFRLINHTQQLELNTYWVAHCCFDGWCLGWLDGTLALEKLHIAESVRDQQRSELSALGGLEALTRKQKLRSEKHLRNIYNMAFTICVAGRGDELWEWIQKAKARSLSDALGLGVLVPKALELQILGNQSTRTLYEEEKLLLNTISNSSDHDRIALRADLWTKQKQMKEHESLRELIELREGHSISLEKIRKFLSVERQRSSPSHLVFVDWFLKDMQFHVCILKGLDPPEIRQCALKQMDVVNWRIKYLDTSLGRRKNIQMPDNDDNPLRELDPLVTPLKDIGDEGSIFVFSVTDVMHSIPVHALWIDGWPVIDSHPVIYSASMTSFLQCQDRAAAHQWHPKSKTIVAVFEKPEGELTEDLLVRERKEMYQAAEELSQEAETERFVGQEASRQVFTWALQRSAMIQFIGHCLLNKSTITDQALVLGDGEFTVRDILNVKLAALVIILIACDSASQTIAPGDEPLGIVSAMLCSGASSVLGTIWPTVSGCGRQFARLFHAYLNESSNEGVIDLAVALQKAVIEIKSEYKTSAPYYWATFVLHGANELHSIK